MYSIHSMNSLSRGEEEKILEAGREAQEKVLFGSFSFKKKNKTPVKICGKAARKTCSETAQRLSRESPSAPKSKRTPLAGESLHPKIDAHPLLRESPSAPKSKHIPSCGRVPPPQNRSARPSRGGPFPFSQSKQTSRKRLARRPSDGGLCFAAFFSPPFYGGSYEGFAGALPLHPATF